MRLRGYGATAWLVDELSDPAGWAAGLSALQIDGVTEVVPGEHSVVVCVDRSMREAVAVQLERVRETIDDLAPIEPIVIDVVYDGVDLDEVAERTGLDVDDVIATHLAGQYVVAFCGFSPGFGYLRNLDPALHLPRREAPRSRVPAGSVAIAARYTGIYPSASPGGWHLLGTTTATLWDPRRTHPALLRPGCSVRFRRSGDD